MPVPVQIVIGRDPGAADVVLDEDAEVSRRHAAFRRHRPDGRDLGSTNGTSVNGERITGTVALRPGDRIEVGSTRIEVRRAEPIVVAPPRPSPRPCRACPRTRSRRRELVKSSTGIGPWTAST